MSAISRLRGLRSCRWVLLLSGLLLADLAFAATYTFRSNNATPSGGGASICSGAWSRSGSTFTCSGDLTLEAGDVLRVRTTGNETLTHITVQAAGSISLSSNTIGTTAKNISLQTSFGSITATGSNSIQGSVTTDSGAITLAGSEVSGSLTGNGTASLTGGSVAGDVSIAGNFTANGTAIDGDVTGNYGTLAFTAGSVGGNVSGGGAISSNGTTFDGSLTSNNGSVTLTGGSVIGQVLSGCCTVTSNGTNLLGGARSNSSGLSITGGTLQGDFYAANNAATFSGVTMTNGTVSGASTVTFNDSTLGSAGSTVTVTSVSGAVTLNNTTAFGDFTAPNYSTIVVNSPSSVTGTCLPNSTPANACKAATLLSWSLDESSWTGAAGEVLDASGNALHGSVLSGASTASTAPALPAVSAQGTCGYGVFNSGSSQYLQRADSNLLDLQGRFTIGLWVKPRTLPASGLMSILSKDENYEFHLNPNGTINWWWQTTANATNQFNSSTALTVGTWNHVLIRFAPNDQSIYINGSLAGQANFSGAPLANSDPLQLGADQGLAGRYFNGELDELRIYNQALSTAQITALMAERHACAGGGSPHHLEFLHDGSALTCQPETVTLRACADAGCSSLYTGTVSAALTPGGWVGGDSLTFSGGSTTAQLRHTTAEAVTLGTGTVTPAATSASVCNSATSGSCTLDFADSGFIFDVPNLLANKPSGVLDFVAAKMSDSGDRCVPAFASGPRTVQFWSTYSTPASGTLPLSVNGTAIGGSSPGTALSINFDANARASIEVHYADAGQMTLDASYTGAAATDDEGLNMSGSDIFVSKPYGLLLLTDTDSGCTADIDCPLYAEGSPETVRRAGDLFSLRIKAVAWQSDGEALTAAALADNAPTPNFQLSDIALASQVMAPAGGNAGTLGSASYVHALGNQTTLSQSISEVGVFRLTATPAVGSYLDGETVSGGESGLVGRFAPDHFDVQISQYEPAECVPGGGTAALFVYAGLDEAVPNLVKTGQPFLFAGSVEARNAADIVTLNYDRDLGFSRLEGAAVSIDDYVGDPPEPPEPPTPATPPPPAVDGVALVANTLSFASGISAITLSGDPTYRFNAPRDAYEVSLIAGVADVDEATGSSAQTMAIDFRLGQARIGNAHGSELQDLSLPFTAAYFNGSSYAPNLLDSCTNFGAASLGGYQGSLGNGETDLSYLNAQGFSDAPYLTSAGSSVLGGYLLSFPDAGNDGSVRVTYATPAWLKFDWDGNGVLDDASGLATFGIYKGAVPLIFRRESYR